MEACKHILLLCIVKAILKKKSRAGQTRLSDFRLYYKATVIKTVWYWHKSNYQWDGMEINPCIYGQLIYVKGGKNIQCRKDKLVSK